MSATDNTGLYFRGETIILWTVFTSSGVLEDQPSGSPTVEVQSVNPANGALVTLLSATLMNEAEDGRYYFQFEIPSTAPLADAQIIYRGVISSIDVVNTTVIQIREKKVKSVAGVAIDTESVKLSCPQSQLKRTDCPPGTPKKTGCT